MWSMGNEEGIAATDRGFLILSAMKAVSTEQDGSRLVSLAPLGGSNMGKFGFAACDVQGYNYADPEADAFHKASPKVPVMGTEQVSAVATRGIYVMDPKHGYVGSYDPYTTTGRASCEGWWSFCNARPWLAGGFIWTGFDYRGEPSPYGWPNISSQYGIIDTCGFPKDSFYYFQSWWTEKPVLHLFPHWNWTGLEGQEIAVWVYSNLDRVELFHNGRSLGAKDMKKDSHLAWDVKYAPGTIEARGFKDGKQVMTAKRETVGPAARLALTVDRDRISADGEDVAMFAVEVQDAQGRTVPVTDNEVSFRLTGQGKIVGVGNGDPTSPESDKAASRKAFCGFCMALAQSTKEAGNITVEATSPGLTPSTVTIATEAAKLRPQMAVWERDVPAGPGVTGLWRPDPAAVDVGGWGGTAGVFTLRQEGGALTGSVEGASGRWGWGGGEAPAPVKEGRVDGDRFSFRAGSFTYTGTLKGDTIELERTGGPARRGGVPAEPSGPRPAIGPPPDGSDPSRAEFVGLGRPERAAAAITLHRAKR
jgi:beta-galactosidase